MSINVNLGVCEKIESIITEHKYEIFISALLQSDN